MVVTYSKIEAERRFNASRQFSPQGTRRIKTRHQRQPEARKSNEKRTLPLKSNYLSLIHFNLHAFFSTFVHILQATLQPNYAFAWIWTTLLVSAAKPVKEDKMSFFQKSVSLRFSDLPEDQDICVTNDESWGQFVELQEEPIRLFCDVEQ
jgi:hypothetical protein